MMHYASQGVRNAVRKGSNTLAHHGGHNGSGGNAANGSTSRSIHLLNVLHTPHTPLVSTLVRPRHHHKLFSASKNFLQQFFTYLTAPGIRAPALFAAQVPGAGSRSLHSAVRGSSIQANISLPARNALRSNARQRQANTFLPRAPGVVPPRFGGVAQVGLGTARNFSSARPIFQQLAQNVPVAGRALYEIDWDIEMRKEHERMRLMARSDVKHIGKTEEMIKPVQKDLKWQSMTSASQESTLSAEDMEQYFPTHPIAPRVTTYLLIPLAPTPTSRVPLPINPTSSPTYQANLLPLLSHLGSIHETHSNHALRVSTLFTRLDQANVWVRGGVHCSAYSLGQAHRGRYTKAYGDEADEGVCTTLKVEFVGWTKAEVRSVIGESGSGWCVLEEIHHEEDLFEDDVMSDMDSLSSSFLDDQSGFSTPFDNDFGRGDAIDVSRSFVLPTIDVSSSPLSNTMDRSMESLLSSIPPEMESDPWVEYDSDSASSSSSYSNLSGLIIDPPSSNGWFDTQHAFGASVYLPYRYGNGRDELEPRQRFY